MKCQYCKKEITEDNLYSIDTPDYVWNFCLDCALEIEDKIFDIIDGQQNKLLEIEPKGTASTVFYPSADTHNHILNWSSYCATSNQRNQCSKETCTIFPICKIKEVQDDKDN